MNVSEELRRHMAENPGMDELTAWRAVRSRHEAQRRYPEVRRAHIAAGRGIYK